MLVELGPQLPDGGVLALLEHSGARLAEGQGPGRDGRDGGDEPEGHHQAGPQAPQPALPHGAAKR